MRVLHLDIETYSSAPLPKCGVYRYCDAPDFEILLLSYAFDDAPVVTVDMACGETLPDAFLHALEDANVLKIAHNAAFERVCFSKHLGHWLDPAQWRCTMVMAWYQTLPGKLADVAVALNVTEKKMEEGKDLIRYFSMPCKATKTNGGRTRNLPRHAPEKWATYKAYNAQDVETERAVYKALLHHSLPEHEWALYALDQRINDRGVRVDRLLVKQAMAVDLAFSQQAFQRAQALTGLDNPGSVSQLKVWLADMDMPMESLSKRIVQEKAAEAEGIVKELLELRLELSKTSIKKYEAMARTVCKDGRVHGMLQFGGASRTFRWAGRLVQLQNVPQNHLPDLKLARDIVKRSDEEQLELLFDSVPNTLSELIRTAFIPRDGCRFIVADFSAIEARVLAWLAGEEWVLDEFRGKGKIYEATASRMFHIPQETIVKGHSNYEYRQKGKQATLSCIAEGQLVLTDQGLVPIEQIQLYHKVWDGENWVSHEGLVYRGRREVITYEGLTATADHLVWIEGKSRPVQLGFAAARGAHLVQTGDGGQAIRLGKDYQRGEAVEREVESLLCAHRVQLMPFDSMDTPVKFDSGDFARLPELLGEPQTDSYVAGSPPNGSESPLRKSKRQELSIIRRTGNQVLLPIGHQGGNLDHAECAKCMSGERVGSYRQQWALCTRKHQICSEENESGKSRVDGAIRMGSGILALLSKRGNTDAVCRKDAGGDHRIGAGGCPLETQKLENHQRAVRLYDLRNAGPHHRFTVSGHLVHNCGYGGGVGALKAMGAKMPEEEMQPLVDAWRTANPHIVQFWYALGNAASEVIEKHNSVRVGKVKVYWRDNRLLIRLPSGRDLCYLSPRYVTNRFGSRGVGYLAASANGKMELQETFPGRWAENCTQAIARDLLAHALQNLEAAGYPIVFHVHDEAVMEAPIGQGSVEEACRIMAIPPKWAQDLPMRADGEEMEFYRK